MMARGPIGGAVLAASLLLAATTGPQAQAPAPSVAPTAHATLTALADGRLLLAGGMTATGIGDGLTMITPSRTVTTPLLSPRFDHRATLLADGGVALTGGADARGPLDSVEIVETGSGTSRLAGVRLARPLSQHAAALLPDGRLLVAGGRAVGGGPLGAVHAFDLDAAQGIELVDLAEPRAGHTATVLTTGEVLIAGGDGARSLLDSAEVWGASANSTPLAEHLHEPRAGHTATLLPSGDVLLAAGAGRGAGALATLERFDAERRTFHRVAARLRTPRAYHTAALLEDGRVLLWGGLDAAGRLLGDGELYDPRTQAVQVVSDLGAVLRAAPPTPRLAESRPGDGATNVAPEVRLALRFSAPLAVTSVSATTVRLAGPEGVVAANAVPAESGLLLFLTPHAALASGTGYTLTLEGLRSPAGVALPRTTIAFTTAGAAGPTPGGVEVRDVTDPDEDDRDLKRDGRSNRRVSPWHDLAALQAPPGVTAVSGQVLQLNGRPLAGVVLELDGQRTRSDATGRFLLRDLPAAGSQVLVIDGRSASRPGAAYGEFEVSVDVAAGRTAVLGYTIWMPKIDWANAVPIPSPTTQETVISTPRMPGFEIRIPAGTVIRDREGQVVRQVSITPIPNDRPPFPMPEGVTFPSYFTVQPGGAHLETDPRVAEPGARVVYPNPARHPPGSEAAFWSYEPQGGVQWYRYGVGRVNAQATEFEAGDGMRLYKFTMFTLGWPVLNRPAATTWANLWGGMFGGDPVDLSTGLFVLSKTDLALADVLPLTFTRTYRPNDGVTRSFGIGAAHSYDLFLYSESSYTTIALILPGGERVRYQRTSPGTLWAGAVLEHTETPGPFYKSVLRYLSPLGDPGTWTLTLREGTVYTFTYNGNLQAIADRFGNTITLTRDLIVYPQGYLKPWGKILRITGPSVWRHIDLTYDSQERIVQAQDHQGRVVGYTYDGSGRLATVTDPAGGVTEYTYDASHRMLTLKDARGIVFLTNTYDAGGRVQTQTQADSTTYQFAYTVDGGGKVTQTDLTNPRGYVRRATFDAAGYALTDTQAQGQGIAQTTTYTRQAGTNFVLTATDPLGRETAFTYDGQGNVASVTRLNGTPDAVTTSFTYETPGAGTFNRLTSVTTPIATTSLAYNNAARTITITDPLGHATVITHTTKGQVASIANALSHTTTLTYDALGQLTTITDPLSQATTRAYDGYGRLIRQTDPKGRATAFSYDRLNQLTTLADAKQGMTRFTYDANGNLLSVTDARNNTTSYTYTSMDRVATRTDPLNRQETYAYDTNGILTSLTDRKSQTTTLAYDALDQLTSRSYHDASTIGYTWDAGNRLGQVVDSVAGTITLGHDALDRLVSEATPNGTVEYSYDALGRRLTMEVPGQAPISYTWDTADRLQTITQGSAVVDFDYDNANRRTKLTYPSGTSTEYAYDTASRLTGLTYKHGGNTLGALTYAYDAASQRTQVGGSRARTNLPAALASATYNAANHQTAFGGQTLTYDLNGNLTGDGTNTYTWNARNQLASISGPIGGSFVYDAFGRRQRKTVDGVITDFVYDGLNPVRQAVGANTVDLLTGLGIDEYLTRTDASSTQDLLSDALGSTVSLTDASGTVQTEYSYEPFGATTASGSASGNELRYTGREDDGTSLYYYRARYYHPGLQRFISEDPIRFEGGDVNLYAYVANNPVRWTDPLGLRTGSVCVKLSIGGFGFGGGGGTCINVGYDKKQGFSTSLSGTAGAGGFAGFGGSVGFSLGGSNAPTVFDLTGGSVSLAAGGGAGVVGGGSVWTSTNPQIQGAEGFIGYGLKVNPALAVPVAVEGYYNTTSTILGYGSRRGLVGPSQ